MKKLFITIFFTFIFIIGCKTQNDSINTAILIQRPERMFWEIKGPKNSIYIQGTIHVGTDEMYPLDKNVLKSFKNSKLIYAEISSKDITKAQSKILSLMFSSIEKDKTKRIEANITKTEKKVLIDTLGKTAYTQLNKFKPWAMNLGIMEVTNQKLGVDPQKGIDMFLYQLAKKQKKEVLGLDELETQLNILKFGTNKEQIYMLKETIASIKNQSYQKEFEQLIIAYLEDNRSKLEVLLNSSIEYESEEPEIIDLQKKYYNALILERNTRWTTTISELLNQHNDVFIFAGSAHFLGEDSVFNIMQKNGSLELKK